MLHAEPLLLIEDEKAKVLKLNVLAKQAVSADDYIRFARGKPFKRLALHVRRFEAVDYAGEFAYASTKQLFDEGFIKATKEKKVDLNNF